MRNGWQICTASKSFAVYAATATEKSEWMLHINNCISEVLMKGKKIKVSHGKCTEDVIVRLAPVFFYSRWKKTQYRTCCRLDS